MLSPDKPYFCRSWEAGATFATCVYDTLVFSQLLQISCSLLYQSIVLIAFQTT